MAEDIDKLAEWASSQGFRVKHSANGYRHFYTASGEYVGYYPATPSRPARRLARLILDLRKAGLSCPPPSKKELRAQRRKEEP
ncbi:MAG: hypothetical protein M3Z25_03570 [Actinomycetota bacterium]|nr:hypothetical protein [Actinomycetota bacterium]